MTAPLRELIAQCIERAKSFIPSKSSRVRTFPAGPFDQGVPTLEPGIFRQPSPQIRERFELFGRWEWATHGHWLSVDDLQALWDDERAHQDKFLSRVRIESLCMDEGGWSDSAHTLFKPSRLTLFAASDLDYQCVFLLWFESEDEPEVWAYDSNGESRYKDLAGYLRAYLDSDTSASQRHRWKLAEIERHGVK
jgi:hypothetical protein